MNSLKALKLMLSNLFQTKVCKTLLLQQRKRKFVKIFLQRRVIFPLHVLFIETYVSYKLCSQAITHFANCSGLSAHKLELLLII